MKRLVITALIFAFPLSAYPQSSAVEIGETNPLVHKLMEVLQFDTVAIALEQQVIKQMRDSMQSGFEAVLSSKRDAQQYNSSNNSSTCTTQELSESLEKRIEGIMPFFEKRLKEEVNFRALLGRVYEPIYIEKYSLEEMQELVAFYQTPLGQKMVLREIEIQNIASPQISGTIIPIVSRIGIEGVQQLMSMGTEAKW